MQSRRDHLQAYQFAVGRLVRAAATGDEGGTGDVPFRRSNLGVFAGFVLAVLLSGGFVVYGLISPANTAWQKPGTIIVEKETGTRYLLVDGELHPVANIASAMLAVGQQATVQDVPRAQLAGLPVGGTIGIAGAPDDPPQASALLPGDWALCLRPNGSIVLDLAPTGRTSAGPTHQRLFVISTDPADPQQYLIWGDVKYPVDNQGVLGPLGLGTAVPLPAAPAWLAAFPTGTPVAPAAVPGAGSAGPAVGGQSAKVGTVFDLSAGGTDQYYVLLSDGLAPITATEASLFNLARGQAARQVDAAAVAAAPRSANRSLLTRLPDFLSGPVYTGDASLCALQTSPGSPSATRLVDENADKIAADPSVVVPAGGGMLAQLPVQSQFAQPVVFLITDSGQRFLLADTQAQGALGYDGANPVTMPASVLQVIPSGPELSVAAARQAVKWPSG